MTAHMGSLRLYGNIALVFFVLPEERFKLSAVVSLLGEKVFFLWFCSSDSAEVCFR